MSVFVIDGPTIGEKGTRECRAKTPQGLGGTSVAKWRVYESFPGRESVSAMERFLNESSQMRNVA
jgi:hypothetical protein